MLINQLVHMLYTLRVLNSYSILVKSSFWIEQAEKPDQLQYDLPTQSESGLLIKDLDCPF